jgi:predicted house-cleaning noncanonical NTP pyrophosphatase (MazG superfamily)
MERLIRDNAINPSKKKKGRNFFRILEKNSEFVIFLLNKYDEEILAFKQASQDKKTEEAGGMS